MVSLALFSCCAGQQLSVVGQSLLSLLFPSSAQNLPIAFRIPKQKNVMIYFIDPFYADQIQDTLRSDSHNVNHFYSEWQK